MFSLGSQFDHLIKQQLDKLGVFCLVADPKQVKAMDVKKVAPTGIILSGGPASVYQDATPFDKNVFNLEIPVLGICLGFQLWASHIGCQIVKSKKREFGTHKLFRMVKKSLLFKNCPDKMAVLESHGDSIQANGDINILAQTKNTTATAANHKHLWGVQFHPEVTETEYGSQIFHNFCFCICGAKDVYPAKKVAEQKIDELRKKIYGKKVLLALSGGSDSSVVAYLLKHSLSNDGYINAIYIKGIDRPDDENHVIKFFANQDWVYLNSIDATNDFIEALKGKINMREKRIAVRNVYKKIIEDEAKRCGADFIVQGTLYTDISESGKGYSSGAKKAQIKLHHNVNLDFSVEELTPIDDCVKDNARNIGREIDVPEELLTRHPFPGPGQVVRVEGEITTNNLEMARSADKIYIEELRKWNLYNSIWQAGAVVTKSTTTCTKGDNAVSGCIVLLWAVWSVNGFTARWARLPYDFLDYVSRRITNEIPEVGAVTFRISDKPPSTIEIG